jgi:hypothetical protein
MLVLALVAALASAVTHYTRRRLAERTLADKSAWPASQQVPVTAHGEAEPPASPAPNPEFPMPTHGYVPDSRHPPRRAPGHLFLDTSPTGADVWIDGALRGKTPVDLTIGPGGHRMAAIKSGYLTWRAVYDTTRGEFARTELRAVSPPAIGDAFLEVRCHSTNHYPIVLDDEETGLLCPASRVPVAAGRHNVGIFVPSRRTNVTIEVDVPAGRQPTRVVLDDGPGAAL